MKKRISLKIYIHITKKNGNTGEIKDVWGKKWSMMADFSVHVEKNKKWNNWWKKHGYTFLSQDEIYKKIINLIE